MLLRRINSAKEIDEQCVYEFEAVGENVRLSEMLRHDGGDDHSAWEGQLPKDYPEGILTFKETLSFVKNELAPAQGPRIGEAEIRHVMEHHSCNREEAILVIEFHRDKEDSERRCPEFGALMMLHMMAASKGCTWSMQGDEKGNWTFKVNTPNPRDRFISENGLFSQVAMDTIHHLTALPRGNTDAR